MNDTIQDAINGLAGRSIILDDAMKLAASDLIFLIVPFLLALWLWAGAEKGRSLRQRVSLVTALAIMAALGAGTIVSGLHAQARPFVSDASTRLLVSHSADNGFPSDHATVAFTLAGVLLVWRPLAGLAAAGFASVIGIARVFVGVHWPGDIVAGAAIGLVTGVLLAQTIPWWSGLQRWVSRRLPGWLIAAP